MKNRGSRALLFALALVAASVSARTTAQDQAPIDRKPWLIAGPFPFVPVGGLENALDPDYLAYAGLATAGEAAVEPSSVATSAAKAWREYPGQTDGQGVDFIAAFGRSSFSVAYAYREVYAANPRRAALKIGSDDSVKVWVNGELVLTDYSVRALSPDQDAVTVSLAKGKNRILVKVAQVEGEWGFLLRVASLADEAKASASAKLDKLLILPDSLAFPSGGTISGVAMTSPAFCIEGAAKVELVGPRGESLASAEASIGGKFSIKAPAGYRGPARLKISGKSGLTSLASGSKGVLLGDAGELAVEGAARARRAASASKTASYDAAPTLELLAQELEGSIESSLEGPDRALMALAEVDDIAPADGRKPAGVIRGLARFAYRSAVDGSLQPYSLYVPRAYDPSRRYGLVVALHGATGNDFEMAASLASAEPEDMLVVAPLGRGDLGYASTGERDVLDVTDLILSRYAIDPDRVYLTGRSMGGYGTWRIGQLYPWKFAALASFAGWTSLDCLENLISIPVLAVHGSADDVIPIEPDAKAVSLLKSLGGNARFDVLPGVGHGALEAWTAKDGAARLFSWFRQFKRAPWPQAMKVRATMARVGRGAWGSILGLAKPNSLSALDARIVDARHVAVDTENVSAFSLDLRHPALAKGGRILILADGVNLTADSGNAAARFEVGPDGRFQPVGTDGRFAAAAPVALPNGGSGLAALYDGGARVVYGTRKRGTSADNAALAAALAGRQSAQPGVSARKGTTARPEDGALSTQAPIARFLSRLELLSDAALSPEIEASSSLILVGWPDENAVVARLAAKLPLKISGETVSLPSEGVSGSGFILCLPNPEAPGRLLAIFALPFRGKPALDFARVVTTSLRVGSASQGEAGFATPDLLLLDRSGVVVWAGCYDWKWGKLTKVAAR